MTQGTYAPRVKVHPDRFGSYKTSGPNLWAVLHTSEGGESTTAAESLGSFMTRPGDRPNGRGGMYGSSYHAVFDTDRIIPAVPYNVVAYSAGGGNAQGVHGCFPGKAGQTREQWLDPVSRAMIRQCAAWLVDIQAEFKIPIDRKMYPSEMLAGDKGLCDHHVVSQAFKKSTHTDVGPNFPWDVLFQDIQALTTPPPLPPLEGVPDVFTPIQPLRNSDTRDLGSPDWPGPAAGEYRFGLSSAIPAGVVAVALNVAAISKTAGGFVTIWPGGPRPDTSCVNFIGDGKARNGAIIVGVKDHAFSIFTSAQAHLICDVTGYWTA